MITCNCNGQHEKCLILEQVKAERDKHANASNFWSKASQDFRVEWDLARKEIDSLRAQLEIALAALKKIQTDFIPCDQKQTELALAEMRDCAEGALLELGELPDTTMNQKDEK